MLVLDLSMTMVLCITSYQFNSTIWFHFAELQTLKVVVNSSSFCQYQRSTNEQLNISILMYCWQIRVKNHILDTPTIHNSSSTCWYDYREKSRGRQEMREISAVSFGYPVSWKARRHSHNSNCEVVLTSITNSKFISSTYNRRRRVK